jgi:hypothetical protein
VRPDREEQQEEGIVHRTSYSIHAESGRKADLWSPDTVGENGGPAVRHVEEVVGVDDKDAGPGRPHRSDSRHPG